MIDLSGETALVTGGTRNIGLSIAKTLKTAGANVSIIGGSDPEALEKALGILERTDGNAMGMLVNVADEKAVVKAYDKVEAQLGPVSILVNGAANRPHEPLKEMSRESWDAVLNVILTGAFLTSRELFIRLPQKRRGAIINIGGLSAHRPAKDRAHVISAKAGLVGLTRALAEEGLGRIRVNCVVPGVINTKRAPGQKAPQLADGSERPPGTPEDVARAVVILADLRDVYITGQTLHVNGGRLMP